MREEICLIVLSSMFVYLDLQSDYCKSSFALSLLSFTFFSRSHQEELVIMNSDGKLAACAPAQDSSLTEWSIYERHSEDFVHHSHNIESG